MPSDLDLHITFTELPAIWRSVRVPDHISLEQLHHVIQLLMGWDNKHLHVFDVNGREYGTVLEDESQGPSFAGSDRQITLAEAVERSRDSLSYTYDFGDEWICPESCRKWFRRNARADEVMTLSRYAA